MRCFVPKEKNATNLCHVHNKHNTHNKRPTKDNTLGQPLVYMCVYNCATPRRCTKHHQIKALRATEGILVHWQWLQSNTNRQCLFEEW